MEPPFRDAPVLVDDALRTLGERQAETESLKVCLTADVFDFLKTDDEFIGVNILVSHKLFKKLLSFNERQNVSEVKILL